MVYLAAPPLPYTLDAIAQTTHRQNTRIYHETLDFVWNLDVSYVYHIQYLSLWSLSVFVVQIPNEHVNKKKNLSQYKCRCTYINLFKTLGMILWPNTRVIVAILHMQNWCCMLFRVRATQLCQLPQFFFMYEYTLVSTTGPQRVELYMLLLSVCVS